MWRILLRILASLTVLHGLATLVAARLLPLSAIGDRLLFAQHGFAFIFLALLNLVIWQEPARGWMARIILHGCNAVFCGFYVAMAVHHSEPPNWTAVVLVAGMTLVGLAQELSARSRSRNSTT